MHHRYVLILCSTFIYSIIGPVATKLALEKAGEIVIAQNKNQYNAKN